MDLPAIEAMTFLWVAALIGVTLAIYAFKRVKAIVGG